MVRISSVILSLALAVIPSVLATSDEAAVKARNLARRERGLATLAPSVRAWVEQLDERDVTFDDSEGDADALERRAGGPQRRDGGSILNCIDTRQAVTFDDGPYTHHLDLANKWNAAGHKLTYFINGNNFGCAYNKPFVSYMRKSVAAGNVLAYHSWSHPHFQDATLEQLDHQVELMQNLTLKTVGVTAKYWRFPYGEQRADQIAHLKKKWDIETVYWSDDTQDADGGSARESIAYYNNLDTTKPHIILNHETVEKTYSIVSNKAIAALDKKGKKSRTIHTCVGGSGSAYHVQVSPKARDATWTCEGTPAPGVL
ncbi:unnamed protein product [Sympodiomycopsis kandeliae]